MHVIFYKKKKITYTTDFDFKPSLGNAGVIRKLGVSLAYNYLQA